MREGQRRQLWRGAATFALIVAIGLLAWAPLAAPFTRVFCRASDALLSSVTFGRGGHVSVEYAPARGAAGASEADDSWNARVRLRIEGVSKENSIRVNPKRLAYIPLVFYVAILLALPLAPRSKALCALIGAPVLLLSAVWAVWTSAAWVFARVPGLVYDFSPWQNKLLHFAYEGLVTPLGNKLLLPLAVGGALFLWQSRRAKQPLTAPQ